MLRRSHRKSRGGCFECKRRHVKCDEHRPICRLCANSDRTCHYPVQVPENNLTDISRACFSGANVIDFNQDTTSGEKDRTSKHLDTPSDASTAAPSPSSGATNTDDASSESINFTHMDLLIHITQDADIFNIGAGIESYHPSGLALGLKEALAHPYLMHEMLGFSARHLAHLHPHRAPHYLDLSVRLQTRALSLFNDMLGTDGVTDANCVAVVLFSSILGHHVLACTLGSRSLDLADVDAVVGQYVQCMDTQRGIHTIATSAWPSLMASELAPILAQSQEFTSRAPVGADCDVLAQRVAAASGMSAEEKEACRRAIGYLQVGFDATATEEVGDRKRNRHHMIYTWTMLVPRDFAGLLVRKQPEALGLLAYYAVLLHRGRELWQVGGAGRYLFDKVDGYLGEEWDEVLDMPRGEILGVCNT
ncbi:putative C6 finger domain protein [Phaeosphaeria sp. MPI-PUGE-AT-0046c]|nr:putative C6 finger domain protein [Phaeosphaeria sp. MPI-PUGE-AT-0046c]